MHARPERKLAKRLVSPESGLVCPDHWSGPDWVYTDGPAVAEINAKAGFAPDPQQELGLDLIFAVGANGLPAAFSFCVICCRQNLKTGLLKQAALGWLFVTDERRVVWSAHEMSTTAEAQLELGELMEGSPALSKRMMPQRNRGIYGDNGSERIELRHNGATQKLLFKARRKTGGRGLAGDKVVLDEAFALEASHTASLLPTMAARPNGQVLYASSAGLPGSAILRDVRDRGRKGTSPRMFYLEWGGAWRECRDADGAEDPDCTHPKDAEARGLDCALDDRELWAHNNPTITTGRISLQTIADLRQELAPEDFAIECMGRWPKETEDVGPPVLNAGRWAKLKNPGASQPTRAVAVVDVEPDQTSATIGLAGAGSEGKVLVLSSSKPGINWPVEGLAQIEAELLEVALTPRARAAFGRALKKAKVEFTSLTASDLALGCKDFQNQLDANALEHVDQVELNAAVGSARTKDHGEGEVWDRGATTVPMGPLVTTSIAAQRWPLVAAEKPLPPPPKPVRVGTGARTSRSNEPSMATVGF